METIQTPIAGSEDCGDPSRPEHALRQFYRAFNGRDLVLMSENWWQRDEIAMDNPLGGIKRGWTEIRSVYERLFGGPARVYVEFHDYTLHVSPELFYAVGRERGTFEAGKKKIDLQIRTSRVYRLSGGLWKQVHHHGSIDSPALLAAYQSAVSDARPEPSSIAPEGGY
ncbi:MAG: nuclear transport factor 2 family protein [Burkholderiales bacterium]